MAPYDSSMKTLAITVDLCLVLHERARTVAGGVELFFLLSFLSFFLFFFFVFFFVPFFPQRSLSFSDCCSTTSHDFRPWGREIAPPRCFATSPITTVLLLNISRNLEVASQF